ncbi:DUF3891 family protein [Pontibacter sp. SGAir0037]|uniref:DUF3891 family protein n=1 Tax=Pontibacter sp. SGAir0037 TaxID=2571030 RepID=UPI0010CCFA3B|nr:DUF3891 family protein [Pontibacter sp. SGAir0037]QCR24270.1 DUF3891 domain-containing protein [Pontibacter sp. SGAir0037]
MIVNAIAEGWEVIYQQAHGVLAAQLACSLKPALRSRHWVETIIAIANHDNRQKTWHGKDGLTKAGAPADFTLLPVTIEQAKDLMQEVRFQSQWVTLLTSMHMSYLYESQRGKSKDIAAFMDEQVALQKRCRKSVGVNKQEAEQAYTIMQWCDRLSLILCRNELPEDERTLEITAGPDGNTYFIKHLKDKAIQVAPWPFEQNKLDVQVEYRTLQQLQYSNDSELAQALHKAEVKRKTWTLAR